MRLEGKTLEEKNTCIIPEVLYIRVCIRVCMEVPSKIQIRDRFIYKSTLYAELLAKLY